jgi:hypothetical protein
MSPLRKTEKSHGYAYGILHQVHRQRCEWQPTDAAGHSVTELLRTVTVGCAFHTWGHAFISLANWKQYDKCKPQFSLRMKLRRNSRMCRTGHIIFQYKITGLLGSAITVGKKTKVIFSYEILSRNHKIIVFSRQRLSVMLVVSLPLKEFPLLGVSSVP